MGASTGSSASSIRSSSSLQSLDVLGYGAADVDPVRPRPEPPRRAGRPLGHGPTSSTPRVLARVGQTGLAQLARESTTDGYAASRFPARSSSRQVGGAVMAERRRRSRPPPGERRPPAQPMRVVELADGRVTGVRGSDALASGTTSSSRTACSSPAWSTCRCNGCFGVDFVGRRTRRLGRSSPPACRRPAVTALAPTFITAPGGRARRVAAPAGRGARRAPDRRRGCSAPTSRARSCRSAGAVRTNPV